MKKGVLILLLLIILGGVGAGVYFGTQKKKDDDDDDNDDDDDTGTGGGGDKRRDEKTPPNDFANGSMIHLDRHHVKCDDDGLSGMNLMMEGDSKMTYKYKCLDGIDSPPGPLKSTNPNDWGGNNAIYLDRHFVDCGKAPVTEFKLVRPTSSQIAYHYKCSTKEASGACRDVDVKSTVKGKVGKTDSMMNTNVACNKDEVLTNFRFYRANANTTDEVAAYKYKCCKM